MCLLVSLSHTFFFFFFDTRTHFAVQASLELLLYPRQILIHADPSVLLHDNTSSSTQCFFYRKESIPGLQNPHGKSVHSVALYELA